jgi:ATP-binding cassette subfamily B protein
VSQVISSKKSYIDPRDLPSVDRATLRRALGYLRPHTLRGVGVLVVLVAVAAMNLLPPLLIKEVVDLAIPQRRTGLLVLLCAGMIVGPLLAGLLQVLQKVLTTSTSEQVMLDLRVELFSHLQSQPLSYFTQARPGEALSRVLNDVQGAGSAIATTLVSVASNFVTFVLSLVAVVWLDWRLALLALVLLPVYVIPTRRVGRRRKALKRESQGLMAQLTGLLAETLSISGAQLIKVFGTEEVEADRVRAQGQVLMDVNVRQALAGRWFTMVLGVIGSIGPALVFAGGGLLVMRGEVGLGTVVAFVSLIGKLYGPAASLAGVHVDVVTSYAYFERVFAVLDLEPDIRDAPDAVPLRTPALGAITFRDVSFAYPGSDSTLSHISLEVRPGQTLALVGPSGAGKSTLAALVPRLHEVSTGQLLVDGQDVRSLTLASLRGQIAVVQQETYLFHGTIEENLRYGRPTAGVEQVHEAARAAQLHDVVMALPDGYKTVVGDRGHRLSGGERQRVAIARALLREPRILILDEATSSLDSQSEALVQAAFDRLRSGRTSIVVAHRLSTVRDADQIAVVVGGRIVERGTHWQLLAADGAYARLYHKQLPDAEDEDDVLASTDPGDGGPGRYAAEMSYLARSFRVPRRSA